MSVTWIRRSGDRGKRRRRGCGSRRRGCDGFPGSLEGAGCRLRTGRARGLKLGHEPFALGSSGAPEIFLRGLFYPELPGARCGIHRVCSTVRGEFGLGLFPSRAARPRSECAREGRLRARSRREAPRGPTRSGCGARACSRRPPGGASPREEKRSPGSGCFSSFVIIGRSRRLSRPRGGLGEDAPLQRLDAAQSLITWPYGGFVARPVPSVKICLTSRKSWRPWYPSSRPMPLCL